MLIVVHLILHGGSVALLNPRLLTLRDEGLVHLRAETARRPVLVVPLISVVPLEYKTWNVVTEHEQRPPQDGLYTRNGR